MITIITIDSDKVSVVASPSVNDLKRMKLNKSNVVRLRLLDIPEIDDIVRVIYSDGTYDDLHFSVGIEVNGVLAINNEILYELLDNIF